MKRRPQRPSGVFARLADLYKRMEGAYNTTAHAAGLSCAGCEDNCCRTHFRHHTYIEWIYLWKGMLTLPEAKRNAYVARAHDVVAECNSIQAAGATPRVMCPVNDDGLCGLYNHRLMICRLHGTRNVLHRPDGQRQLFRGCYRFDALTSTMAADAIPSLDRTPLYKELAQLEMEHLGPRAANAPRVSLTLAEMLVYGPPKF